MKYDCVQAKMDAVSAKYPSIAAILADEVQGGWMGNETPIDALLGSDEALRQAIWQYSLACQYEGDPRHHRKNARQWYNLLCIEQMQRVAGSKCDALTEYRCTVWQASFAKIGGAVRFSCAGCEKGIAHETEMRDLGAPVYAPIDGGIHA